MSQSKPQPRRRNRILIGDYGKRTLVQPSKATVAKAEAFKAKYPGTEIKYGQDGRVEEILNHEGLLYEAATKEQLINIVLADAEIRDLCDLDTPGAVTEMRYLGATEEEGNLGTSIESQQVHEDRLIHAKKFSLNAIDNKDGTWSVWRILNTTESASVDTAASLALSEDRAIKKAEQSLRKALKLKDKRITCTLDADRGGYEEQYNRAPGSDTLKPCQRIRLLFVDPDEHDLTIPVEVIIDYSGKVVFARDLNCYLHAKAFLIEPMTTSVEAAAKQLQIFDIDEKTLEMGPNGRVTLKDNMVKVLYDPKDRGNANTILEAQAGGKDFVHELGTAAQAAVNTFTALRRCAERHARTGSPETGRQSTAYVGVERMFGQRITNNAAYFPSAGVMVIGLLTANSVSIARHLLAIPQVIYHERGHEEDHRIHKAKNKNITGRFWMGVGERNGDVDAFLFTLLDILEHGHRLGIKLTYESFMKMKGEIGMLPFGSPIRVMDNEWTFPMDEGGEEHDIGEKVDALSLHTIQAWVTAEYNKAITPTMSEAEKNVVFEKVIKEMAEDNLRIRKSVESLIKEDRPGCVDLLHTSKLVARRNFGADVESYLHQGYTVRHGVPDASAS